MVSLSNLVSFNKKKSKRIGRGYGSRGGHTVGRGTKGQKARGKVRPYFEGGQLPLVKRLPHKKGFSKPFGKKYTIFNVDFFNKFRAGAKITPDFLVKNGILKKVERSGIKILGNGELSKKLEFVGFKYSKSAVEKIEKAGGHAK